MTNHYNRPQIKKVRVGYAQGYNKQTANKGRFVITDAELKKIKSE